MDVSRFVALRYLQSSGQNRFFSWMALLSIAGIAIAVAAMIVVLSVINGFESELRKRFLHANAHIMAYRYPAGLSDPARWAEVVKKDFPEVVTGVSPFVHHETMARKDSLMHSVLVRGIVPNLREKVQSAKGLIRPPDALDILQQEVEAGLAGKSPPKIPSALLGSGILSLIDAEVGDTVEMVEPDTNNMGELKTFRIVGVYDSGLKHYDNKLVILSLPSAQRFFKTGTRVTGIEIGLIDPMESPAIAEKMTEKYAISIREWQSFNRPLFEAMKMERIVIVIIVALVAIVASFNILTTLFISVTQKQKDISILKAIGARNSQIMKLFITQSTITGVVGSIIGCVLALAISAALEHYQFVDLPDLYLLAQLPMTYDWRVYLGISGFGTLLCLVAGLYPSMVAARVAPTVGFRGYDNTT